MASEFADPRTYETKVFIVPVFSHESCSHVSMPRNLRENRSHNDAVRNKINNTDHRTTNYYLSTGCEY